MRLAVSQRKLTTSLCVSIRTEKLALAWWTVERMDLAVFSPHLLWYQDILVSAYFPINDFRNEIFYWRLPARALDLESVMEGFRNADIQLRQLLLLNILL
jgi:hypothetical protein